MKFAIIMALMVAGLVPSAWADMVVHSNPSQASDEMRQKLQNPPSKVETGCANGLSKVTYPECTFTVKKRAGEPDDQK